MRILAIETSCDDRGIALIDIARVKSTFRIKVIKNLISSQIATHRPFGGVVPNLAKREHTKNLPILLKRAGIEKYKPDAIAVTVGPGLEPALWTGIEFAKRLSKELKIPLVGANHLEGHVYSFLLSGKTGGFFSVPPVSPVPCPHGKHRLPPPDGPLHSWNSKGISVTNHAKHIPPIGT